MDRERLVMYFMVEGESEKRYLEWLERQITAESPKYRADFKIAVTLDPISFAKRYRPPAGSTVYVLLDYESRDRSHELKFQRTLKALRETGERRHLNFMLGYSNYAFELWLILHRMPFTKSVYHRHDYLDPINKAYGTRFRSLPNYKQARNYHWLLGQLSLDDVRAAIERARAVRSRNNHHGKTLLKRAGYRYYREDPSLSVDEVIQNVLERADLFNDKP